MSWLFTKYFIAAAVVVLVSELAKRSEKFGGLVACVCIAGGCFVSFALIVRRFGIELL